MIARRYAILAAVPAPGNPSSKLIVCHLIETMQTGGADTTLLHLAAYHDLVEEHRQRAGRA